LWDQEKLEEAIEKYQKALQLNPEFFYAYNGWGSVLLDQGKLEEAIANYRQALQINPDFAVAYNNLGYALQQQGKLQEAIEKYKRALEIDPNYTTAQNNLDEAQRLLAQRRDSRDPIIDDTQYVPSSDQEPLVDVLRSTAKILAQIPQGNSIATGWVIKREGDTAWLITNRHVLTGDKTSRLSDKIEVEFFSELPEHRRPRYPATIVKASEANSDLDLAVLKVTDIPEDIQPLDIQTGRVARLTDVVIVGHPYNVEGAWNVVSGEVTNYSPNNPMLTVDATLAQGNSGGPIVTSDGEQVIGLMAQIRDTTTVATNPDEPSPSLGPTVATGGVGLAYRIELVWNQLQEWGILQE
ncbi:tetratricopeptide repeat protein, partial [Geitlerinema sp. PCC 9228]|uniref:tetratricopeptide repeat protein n=1 Tax=Geitlerinema sp. PCC 9228 TaxID=111611 RepID=UPI0008F9B3E2